MPELNQLVQKTTKRKSKSDGSKNKSTTIYINKEVLSNLEKYCMLMNKTKSAVINDLIADFVKKNKSITNEVDEAIKNTHETLKKIREKAKIN